jgi:hypothetical protein
MWHLHLKKDMKAEGGLFRGMSGRKWRVMGGEDD